MTTDQHRTIEWLRTLGYTVEVRRRYVGNIRRIILDCKLSRGLLLLNVYPDGTYVHAALDTTRLKRERTRPWQTSRS